MGHGLGNVTEWNMNRREFLAAPLVPVIAAMGMELSPKSTISTGVEKRVLSEHQNAVVRILQNNIRREYRYMEEEFSKIKSPMSHTGSAPSKKYEDELVSLIPRQFEMMDIPQIAGVQPTSGPTSLIYVKNKATRPDLSTRYNGVRETQQDILASSFPQRGLDTPSPIHHVNKMFVTVSTSEFGEPKFWYYHVDKSVVGYFSKLARPGTWDNLNGLINPYVICNPLDRPKVKREAGLKPFTNWAIPQGEALIGFKEDEYHASFYWVPYIPIQLYGAMDTVTFAPKIKYKSRHGFVPGIFNLEEIELWKVKV